MGRAPFITAFEGFAVIFIRNVGESESSKRILVAFYSVISTVLKSKLRCCCSHQFKTLQAITRVTNIDLQLTRKPHDRIKIAHLSTIRFPNSADGNINSGTQQYISIFAFQSLGHYHRSDLEVSTLCTDSPISSRVPILRRAQHRFFYAISSQPESRYVFIERRIGT